MLVDETGLTWRERRQVDRPKVSQGSKDLFG